MDGFMNRTRGCLSAMMSSYMSKLIGRIPSLKLRYSTDNFKIKPFKKDEINKLNENSSRIQLSTGQIEQYKRQLYELIKERKGVGEVKEMTRFLVEKCEPSLHLYNVILKGQLMMRNVEGIKETLLLIAKNKFAFNSVTMNLLLVYYRDLDMMEEAEKLFEAMQKQDGKDVNPLINCAGANLAAYTTMIAGWGRRGDFEKAKKYFEAIGKDCELTGFEADEHAKSAILSAAVNTGHLEYAKRVYESLGSKPNFVTMKLWLRATFRLGGYEEALDELISGNDGSLELGELIKWILNDLKQLDGIAKVSLHVLERGLRNAKSMRLGDPQCLHALVDVLKKDPESLKTLTRICLTHPAATLPVIGGRLLHQLVATKSSEELASEIVDVCEKLEIKLPSGLLEDFNTMKK